MNQQKNCKGNYDMEEPDALSEAHENEKKSGEKDVDDEQESEKSDDGERSDQNEDKPARKESLDE